MTLHQIVVSNASYALTLVPNPDEVSSWEFEGRHDISARGTWVPKNGTQAFAHFGLFAHRAGFEVTGLTLIPDSHFADDLDGWEARMLDAANSGHDLFGVPDGPYALFPSVREMTVARDGTTAEFGNLGQYRSASTNAFTEAFEPSWRLQYAPLLPKLLRRRGTGAATSSR